MAKDRQNAGVSFPILLLAILVVWLACFTLSVNAECKECAAVPEDDRSTKTSSSTKKANKGQDEGDEPVCAADDHACQAAEVRKNIVTIHGRIQYEGTIIGGKGYKVDASKKGTYVIKFDAPFSSPPVVLLETTPSYPIRGAVTLQSSRAAEIVIATFTGDGARRSPSQITFAFVAVGPRDTPHDVAVVRGEVASDGVVEHGDGFNVQVYAKGHYFLVYEPNPWAGGHPTVFAQASDPTKTMAGFDSGCPSGHKSEIYAGDFQLNRINVDFQFVSFGAKRYGYRPAENLAVIAGEVSKKGVVMLGSGFNCSLVEIVAEEPAANESPSEEKEATEGTEEEPKKKKNKKKAKKDKDEAESESGEKKEKKKKDKKKKKESKVAASGGRKSQYVLTFPKGTFTEAPTLFVQPSGGFYHPQEDTAYVAQVDREQAIIWTDAGGLPYNVAFRFMAVGPID